MCQGVVAGGFKEGIAVNVSKVCQGDKLRRWKQMAYLVLPRQHSVLDHSNIYNSHY